MLYFNCLRFLAAVAAGCIALLGVSARAEELLQSWPQSRSDIPADPEVHFGSLPNGMRFAIMHNATPRGQAAIRLRIGSGSLNESDDQQGLAHFLEHMAFKGSAHVPEGEIIKILQRKGLAFGPDTNASTSYDETVYSLDLPEVDSDSLSTGLMLMRETVSELTLDAKAFDRERGVILSEERLRDTPQYRASIGVMNLLLEGRRATLRSPIGKTDIIKNAAVDLVRDYYDANYRPDRATLIVVGDIDPTAIEKDIRQRFGDWRPRGESAPKPNPGTLKSKDESVNIIDVPSGMTNVTVGWTRSFDTASDSYSKRHQQLIEEVGLLVLNRRLSDMARKPNASFVSADAYSQDMLQSAHAVLISANCDPDKWQAALSSIDQEQRRILQFGVSQSELDREITEYRVSLQATAAGASTRTTTDIASILAFSINSDQVFTSPSEDLSLFESMIQDITRDDIDRGLADTFSGNGPQVILQTAEPPKGGAVEVRQAYDASRAVAVIAPESAVDVSWPYTSFGAPGVVTERLKDDDLDLTMVRFANGVRLTVKPSHFRKDEVLVRENVGYGRIGLPSDRASAIWASPSVVLSGVKAMDYTEIQKALASNVVSVDFSVGDASFKFSGQTRPKDLLRQLQLLTAYTSDPAYRPEAFDRMKQAYLNGISQYDATPGGVIRRDFAGLSHSGDRRWTFPDRTELASAQMSEFEKLFRPAISNGPIDITIVGDITAEEATELTARTFGALPARQVAQPRGEALNVRFPAATPAPIVRTHTGRGDNAAAIVGAPIGDMLSDLPRSFTANLVGQIFQNRLVDQFRIAEGASYNLQADVDLSKELPGFGYAYIYVETTPAKIARFFALVDEIALDLQRNEVSDDELARAREPQVETLKHQRQSNEYWVEQLQNAQSDPRRLERIRTSLSGYNQVTAKDIRSFALTYLNSGSFWKLEVLPAAGGEGQPPEAIR